MKRTGLYIIVALCLFLSACTPAGSEITTQETVTPAATPSLMLSEQEYAVIDKAIEDIRELENAISFALLESDEFVREVYFSHDYKHKNHIFSVTKSVTSILVGMAIDEGAIKSVNQTLDEFIDSEQYELTDMQKNISIADILTMSMGLYWDDDLSSEYHSLKRAGDKIAMIMNREMAFEPGTEFNYSDGAAHMMSIIFTKATGESLHEYAIENLFEPLGIEKTTWMTDSDGNSYGGFGLHLSCQDMAKIGVLAMNTGEYNGVQIVSADWIKRSTSAKISTGSSNSENNEYGYYWWIGEVDGVKLHTAIGHGGQFIFVVPELDLIITASCYGAVMDEDANFAIDKIRDLVVKDIIPVYINAQLNSGK